MTAIQHQRQIHPQDDRQNQLRNQQCDRRLAIGEKKRSPTVDCAFK